MCFPLLGIACSLPGMEYLWGYLTPDWCFFFDFFWESSIRWIHCLFIPHHRPCDAPRWLGTILRESLEQRHSDPTAGAVARLVNHHGLRRSAKGMFRKKNHVRLEMVSTCFYTYIIYKYIYNKSLSRNLYISTCFNTYILFDAFDKILVAVGAASR